MRATVYGETSKATEYKKEMIVADCGLEWFEFVNGWKLEWCDDSNYFLLYGLKGRLMARSCYIEIG
tara:strand:+ start:145 stop:342 length:198 start_codon:yes stop_codon:yes gene_type:complete